MQVEIWSVIENSDNGICNFVYTTEGEARNLYNSIVAGWWSKQFGLAQMPSADNAMDILHDTPGWFDSVKIDRVIIDVPMHPLVRRAMDVVSLMQDQLHQVEGMFPGDTDIAEAIDSAEEFMAIVSAADEAPYRPPQPKPQRLVVSVVGGCAYIVDSENLPDDLEVFIFDCDVDAFSGPDGPREPHGLTFIDGEWVALERFTGRDLSAQDDHTGHLGKQCAVAWGVTE